MYFWTWEWKGLKERPQCAVATFFLYFYLCWRACTVCVLTCVLVRAIRVPSTASFRAQTASRSRSEAHGWTLMTGCPVFVQLRNLVVVIRPEVRSIVCTRRIKSTSYIWAISYSGPSFPLKFTQLSTLSRSAKRHATIKITTKPAVPACIHTRCASYAFGPLGVNWSL